MNAKVGSEIMQYVRCWQVTALAVLVLAGTAAGAASPPPPEDAVAVTVMGIRATKEKEGHVDPALKPIADTLAKQKFNCFRLVARDTQNVPLKKVHEFALIEDYAVRVQPEKESDDTVTLVVSWIRHIKDAKDKEAKGKDKDEVRTLQKITMKLRKGKYLLGGGWKLKEGALLGLFAVK